MQGHLNEVYSEEGFAIYIGSAANAANTKILKDANIRYILNVSDRVRFRRVVDGPPIIMYHVPLSDYGDTPLSSVLDECFAVINEARDTKGNVLVHCQGGVNRSPTVVIAFLVMVLKWTLKQAWDHVKERRTVASPHEKYMQQLIELEKELYGEVTVDFAEYQSTSLQANLRRIRHQYQTTQLPFQEGQVTNTDEAASLCISSSSPSPSSTLISTTTSTGSTTNNNHSSSDSSELTNITEVTEITAQITSQTSPQQYFPHHLPQLNLECIS